MIRYFCEECGIEVLDPTWSLEMTGKIFCWKHMPEQENQVYKIQWHYAPTTIKGTDE